MSPAKSTLLPWFVVLGVLVAIVVWWGRDREHMDSIPADIDSRREVAEPVQPDTPVQAPIAVRPAPPRAPTDFKSNMDPLPTDQMGRNLHAVLHTYGRLFSRLDLSPEQIQQVNQLLAERMAYAQDVRNIGDRENIGRAAENRLIEQYEASDDAAIAQIVNVEDAVRISRMAKYVGSLGRAEGIALASIEDPSSVDQIIAVAVAIGDASRANPLHNRVAPSDIDPQTGLSDHDRRILQQASYSLSITQLAVLQEHLAEIRAASVARSQVYREIDRQVRENRNTDNVPGR